MDDFSRFTWLFPLHHKSDVFSVFIKFKALVENLYSCKIKQLQTDNGGEYLSNQFKNILQENGINHRLTCPYTSQQNGIAERKHRHIQETGLTLLAKSGLAQSYWVDAFLTSVFLINRMPTKVLHNLSPFFVLNKKIPKYSELRIFGCACYPFLRPYEHHKLSFRSKQCVFLGYSSNQRGYRCLDQSSGRVYVSRHVIFDEYMFPARSKRSDYTTSDSNVIVGKSPLEISVPLYFNNSLTSNRDMITLSPSPLQPLQEVHNMHDSLSTSPSQPVDTVPHEVHITHDTLSDFSPPDPQEVHLMHNTLSASSSQPIETHSSLTENSIDHRPQTQKEYHILTRSKTGHSKPK